MKVRTNPSEEGLFGIGNHEAHAQAIPIIFLNAGKSSVLMISIKRIPTNIKMDKGLDYTFIIQSHKIASKCI